MNEPRRQCGEERSPNLAAAIPRIRPAAQTSRRRSPRSSQEHTSEHVINGAVTPEETAF
jgi:hypothetical protein